MIGVAPRGFSGVDREKIDIWYLYSLSDDALPALIEAQALGTGLSDQGATLEARAKLLGSSESFWTWNLGRARARAALHP